MNTTINTTMDTTFDFDLIKADYQDLVNYINNNKENLDKDKIKELRDNLVQLETILNNILGGKPKTTKKTAKKATAKKVEVETFDNDEGKKFYDNLKVGDEFKYVMSNGTIVTARKVETKSKSGLTAACEVISGLDIPSDKTRKRYPKFNKILKIQTSKQIENLVTKEAEKTEETKQIVETEKPIEQEVVQVAASVETENDNLFDIE